MFWLNMMLAVLVEYDDSKILMFNTYFPCKEDPVYQAEVDIIRGFMEFVMNEIALSNLSIFVAGDFNENLVNIYKLPMLHVLRKFINSYNLSSAQSHIMVL